MASDHPLKRYRDRLGITQEALGKELGVHGVTVSRWETGERNIGRHLLTAISKKTDIPARELRPDLAELMGEAV